MKGAGPISLLATPTNQAVVKRYRNLGETAGVELGKGEGETVSLRDTAHAHVLRDVEILVLQDVGIPIPIPWDAEIHVPIPRDRGIRIPVLPDAEIPVPEAETPVPDPGTALTRGPIARPVERERGREGEGKRYPSTVAVI